MGLNSPDSSASLGNGGCMRESACRGSAVQVVKRCEGVRRKFGIAAAMLATMFLVATILFAGNARAQLSMSEKLGADSIGDIRAGSYAAGAGDSVRFTLD